MTNELVLRVKLDTSDLARITGGTPTSGGGPSTVSGTASPDSDSSSADGVKVKIAAASPGFSSIFKPLLLLEALNKGIGFLVNGSSVANSYLGAMGKMFGAAIDLLLIPFLPIFNLLLVGLSKLVEFMSSDGVQKYLSKLGEDLMKELGDIWGILTDVYGIFSGIIHGDLDQIWSSIKDLVGDVKAFWDDGSPIAKLLVLILGALTVRSALGVANTLTAGLGGKALGAILGGGGAAAGAGTGATGVGGAATSAAGSAAAGVGIGSLAWIAAPIAVAVGAYFANSALGHPLEKGADAFFAPANSLADKIGIHGSKVEDVFPEMKEYMQRATIGTQSNVININGAQDSSTLARLVREELEKMNRGVAGR